MEFFILSLLEGYGSTGSAISNSKRFPQGHSIILPCVSRLTRASEWAGRWFVASPKQ
jgi:hypothetical protein